MQMSKTSHPKGNIYRVTFYFFFFLNNVFSMRDIWLENNTHSNHSAVPGLQICLTQVPKTWKRRCSNICHIPAISRQRWIIYKVQCNHMLILCAYACMYNCLSVASVVALMDACLHNFALTFVRKKFKWPSRTWWYAWVCEWMVAF